MLKKCFKVICSKFAMRSPFFQVNVIKFVLLLLVVAAQAAVDVFILDKNEYPNNFFTLDDLDCKYDKFPNIKGEAYVAVQAKISIEENVASITWPNDAVGSQQNTASDKLAKKGPAYENAFFVLATNPDIDGRRSFIILTNVTAIKEKDIEIKFALKNLTNDEKEMLNEINNLQTSKTSSETAQGAPPRPKVGVKVAKGTCGIIYSVSYEDGPLVGTQLVMKTCRANEPGKVVPLKDWAKIEFMEKINRNDYRIGRLLNTFNEGNNKIGPKYYTDGWIEIEGIHCYYFTMEKIIGKSIDDNLSEAVDGLLNGDLSKFAQIFLAMLNAIIRLHNAGVLHRDLQFGNFMKLDGSEECVTIDYGLSRVAVEWENHIKQCRPILTESVNMFQSLRANFDLGTDFHDELDMFVFQSLNTYIGEKFFESTYEKTVLIRRQIEVLVSNWLKWPHLKAYLDDMTDYLAENLNDMLFLSPTLLYCRSIHDQKLDQDQMRRSLKAMDDKLFPKNAGQVIEYEFNPSGYLVKAVLPVVQDRYKWPQYEEYKTALSNIVLKKSGKRHPRSNTL